MSRTQGGPLSLRDMKRNAARAALDFVEPDSVIGVGSGSTVDLFIGLLGERGVPLQGVVAASEASAARLEAVGVRVLELEDAHPVLYVDGADRIDMFGRALKGRGGALTREKAVASASAYWACIVDASKVTRTLGDDTVVVEVAEEMAGRVAEALSALGARSQRRAGELTDAGNPLLDVTGLHLENPATMEQTLDALPGVVGNGIFAHRRADVILVGRAGGGVSRIVPHELSQEQR